MVKLHAVGQALPRIDAEEKARGQAIFGADVQLPHTLVGKFLSSPPLSLCDKGGLDRNLLFFRMRQPCPARGRKDLMYKPSPEGEGVQMPDEVRIGEFP